jgi:glycosyltransferase involved in cell wall biosynthesis
MVPNKSGTTIILLNALSARQGGGQTYVINLLESLPEQYAAEIFVLAPNSLSLPLGKKNLKKISVNWPVENPFVRAIWERLCLSPLLKRLNADVLFCPGGIIGSRVPPGCKTVTMFRNMIPFSATQRHRYRLGYMKMRNWILKKVLLRSMLRADLVIFLSDYARTVIEERAQGRLKQTATIPHGVSLAFRNSAAANSPPPAWMPSQGYLLYVSTLDYYKAQLEVVQAYAILRQKRATKEKLMLVGPEYPEYGRKVREQVKQLALENDVLITGVIPYSDMPGVYHNALVNIFASESENCPNALIEALAAGRPVFSSNYPPMPEFAGDAAVYFDPKSPDDLAEKLATVLADSDRMKVLARKAAEQSQLYDWTSSAQITWRAIRQLSND